MRASRKPGANSARGSRARPTAVLAAAIPTALLLVVAGIAAAEVYRCVDGEGRISFTDDANACPGSGEHAMQPRIQRLGLPAETAPKAPEAAAAQADAPSAGEIRAQKEMWQIVKRDAEAKLRTVQQQIERLQGYVTRCNRGREFYEQDAAGMRRHVSCDEIHRQHSTAQTEGRRLREYLESGLELECRRAGCLPGWIR